MLNKSMNFIRRLNREKFHLLTKHFKFGGLLAVWKLCKNTKFQLNISEIMPARPKKDTATGGVNTTIVSFVC